MRKYLNGLKANHLAVALAAAGLCHATLAGAETKPDFTNPAVGMSSEAVIASGACIARYTAKLDDRSKPAGQIGQQIAKHCAKQIARSAGLASWMMGKPEEFAKNLKYAQEDLTTNTVRRYRAAP
jgi:RNA 3'-terminal phosphate cyclase